MRSTRLLIAAGAITVFGLSSCAMGAGDDAAGDPELTPRPPVTATAADDEYEMSEQAEFEVDYLLANIDPAEFCPLYLDEVAMRGGDVTRVQFDGIAAVEEGYGQRLTPEGKAILIMIMEDC